MWEDRSLLRRHPLRYPSTRECFSVPSSTLRRRFRDKRGPCVWDYHIQGGGRRNSLTIQNSLILREDCGCCPVLDRGKAVFTSRAPRSHPNARPNHSSVQRIRKREIRQIGCLLLFKNGWEAAAGGRNDCSGLGLPPCDTLSTQRPFNITGFTPKNFIIDKDLIYGHVCTCYVVYVKFWISVELLAGSIFTLPINAAHLIEERDNFVETVNGSIREEMSPNHAATCRTELWAGRSGNTLLKIRIWTDAAIAIYEVWRFLDWLHFRNFSVSVTIRSNTDTGDLGCYFPIVRWRLHSA